MNNCMELLGALINISPYKMVYSLTELLMKWLPLQERAEERWEYFYLLELCVLRIGKFNMALPVVNLQFVDSILKETRDKVLATRIMMFLYSLSFVCPQGENYLSQYLN